MKRQVIQHDREQSSLCVCGRVGRSADTSDLSRVEMCPWAHEVETMTMVLLNEQRSSHSLNSRLWTHRLGQPSDSTQQRNFSVRWTAVNAETLNWSKCREEVSVEYLTTDGTFISHSLCPNSGYILEDRVEGVQQTEVREDNYEQTFLTGMEAVRATNVAVCTRSNQSTF